MKKAIFIVVSLVIIVSALFFWFWHKDKAGRSDDKLTTRNWIDFKPFTNKFAVSLPSEPKYVLDASEKPDGNGQKWYEMYASQELDNTTYLINLISYKDGLDGKNHKNILDNAVNELVSRNLNNQLMSVKEEQYLNKPAIFFHIDNDLLSTNI